MTLPKQTQELLKRARKGKKKLDSEKQRVATYIIDQLSNHEREDADVVMLSDTLGRIMTEAERTQRKEHPYER